MSLTVAVATTVPATEKFTVPVRTVPGSSGVILAVNVSGAPKATELAETDSVVTVDDVVVTVAGSMMPVAVTVPLPLEKTALELRAERVRLKVSSIPVESARMLTGMLADVLPAGIVSELEGL